MGEKYCDINVIFLGYMLNLENSVIGHGVFMVPVDLILAIAVPIIELLISESECGAT